MQKLEDGTVIQMTEEARRFFEDIVKPAYQEGQAVLIVEGHASQSSGRVATVSINLNYSYEAMVKEAIRVIRDKEPEALATEDVPLDVWKTAKEELLASLAESIVGDHSRDSASRSAVPFDLELPRVLVGLSTGKVQLRGAMAAFEVEQEGKPRNPPKAPLTRAKRELEKGTYRESNTVGSIVSLSLRKDGFRCLRCGEHTLSHEAFVIEQDAPIVLQYKAEPGAAPRAPVPTLPSAVRVYQEHGFSERVAVEAGEKGTRELLVAYTHSESRTILVSEVRDALKMEAGKTFVELKQKKNVKSPVWVASVGENDVVSIELLADDSGEVRVGPDGQSKSFIEVGSEKRKRLQEGDELLFVSWEEESTTASETEGESGQ